MLRDRSLPPLRYLILVACVFGAAALPLSASCTKDLKITTVTHQDRVVLPLHIHAETKCQDVANMQLWVDGNKMTAQTGLTLDYDLTGLANGPHNVIVEGVVGNTTLIKAQAITINVTSPPAGQTAVVDIWNPTGCPAANSCKYAEDLPSSFPFYVDAKAYSNQPNIHDVQIWLDGVKEDDKVYQTPGNNEEFHSNVALTASPGNHRLGVQAMDSSGNVLGKTVTYFNVTSANVGTATDIDDVSTDQQTYGVLWPTCSQSSSDPCFSSKYPSSASSIIQFYSDLNDYDSNGNLIWQTAQRHYIWPASLSKVPPNAVFSPNPSEADTFPFKYVRYEFDVEVPAGETPQISNLEWEVQQRLTQPGGTQIYTRNLAFEDNYDPYGTNEWRAFDYYAAHVTNDGVTNYWQSTGVPYIKFTEGQWYHVILEYHMDESNSNDILVRHDAVTYYPLGQSGKRYGTLYHNAHSIPPSSSVETTNAIQLGNNSDSANLTTRWSVYIDHMQVTYTWCDPNNQGPCSQ